MWDCIEVGERETNQLMQGRRATSTPLKLDPVEERIGGK